MRTCIVLDDRLVATAMRLSGTKTKREVVELALRQLVARYEEGGLEELVGQDLIDPDYDIREVRRGMGRGAR